MFLSARASLCVSVCFASWFTKPSLAVPSWDKFHDDLNELERLLTKVMPREAFRAHCLPAGRKDRILNPNAEAYKHRF